MTDGGHRSADPPDARRGDGFVRATARSFAVKVSVACDGTPAYLGRVCVSPPVPGRDCLVATMRVTESALLTPGRGACSRVPCSSPSGPPSRASPLTSVERDGS